MNNFQNIDDDLVHGVLSQLENQLLLTLQTKDFTEISVPDQYALLKGQNDFESYHLITRRFTHPKLKHLTFACLKEQNKLRAITVYALPQANQTISILGLDYVGFGGFLTLAALDLAPTDLYFWNDYAKPHLEACHQSKHNLIERKLPEYLQAVFSDQALILAAKDQSACSQAVNFAIETINRYCQWLELPTQISQPTDYSESLEKWCLAMQQNKKESGALKRLFGDAAESYLVSYLFLSS